MLTKTPTYDKIFISKLIRGNKMSQIHISESNITIENQTFSGSHFARETHPDGTPRGTFRSYTVLVDGDNIKFKNCTFENTAGKGEDVGQAIALYLDGDNISLASKSASGEVYDEMSCAHEGENIKIAFNCRYLINSIRAADSDVIDLTFKSPTQSITIAPHDKKADEDFFYMVQPVRMNE